MPTILIVDDDESVRSILFELLSLKGYDCTMAANAKEARAQLENQAYELVLSDFNMPGESGLELLEHVFSAHPGTAGMILTAMNDSGIERRAREMGVSAYMTKPFRLNELLHNVTEALWRHNEGNVVLHPTCSNVSSRFGEERKRPDSRRPEFLPRSRIRRSFRCLLHPE